MVRPLTVKFTTDFAETRDANILNLSNERFTIVTDLQELASMMTLVLDKSVKVLFSN
jgi:hypothetical protein